jgi:muramoyltetrapeptide carboxypeptidase LdcA involved in peptidoglycan recycling
LSPETDVLISCGGGELMCEIRDYVDFEALKKGEAKWFMGYSDNTNLVFLLATLCDTAAIYGPCAPTFGMEPRHQSLLDAIALLRGTSQSVQGYDKWEKESLKTEDTPLVPYNLTEPRVLKYYKGDDIGYLEMNQHPDEEVHMEGRLIGGCLDCLINLCGTRYDQVAAFNEKYKDDGIVWFLESCDLNPMSIRRGLWELAHAGWFDCVKGFLIGRPYCYGQDYLGLDQYKAVTDILGSYKVPIIMDADIGHLPPMMPLVCGSYGKVEIKGNDIRIDMEYK